MSLLHTERLSDSPLVQSVTHGYTLGVGSSIRPAETNWHMVFVSHSGKLHFLVVGPLTTAGTAEWGEGAEILWIKFKLGTFMPHLPIKHALNMETSVPHAASRSFWLNGSAWQAPDFENADTFVNRLIRQEVLVHDPMVEDVLQGRSHDAAARTVRYRFLRATGLTQTHIRQVQRSLRAAELLKQGKSILDTVEEAGYFDQPHLTRALKQWVGHTPAQIIRMRRACHSIQDSLRVADYNTPVLKAQIQMPGVG